MRNSSRALAALAVSFFAVLAGGGDSRDVSASFTAASPVTLSTKAANTVADTTITTTIPSGDYNFSLIAWGTPSQATVAYGPGHTSFLTTHPALGDIVGTFTTTASYFGFSDTPCAANVTLSFTLLNATVDKTSAISPLTSPGPAGPLENMWTDTGGGAAANGLPAQVDKFPSYLNTLFTPDGGSSVQPRARYAAAAKVAGTVLTLNFVVFDSDALANAFAPPHPFDDLKGLGYTTVVVLNDPTQPGSQVSVTDFCTPFTSMTTLFGQSKVNPCKVTPSSCTTPESINSPSPGSSTGKNRYNNPGTGGTYLWTAFHQSLRDTDGDGKENQLDPCPTTVDSLNPLLIGGDITNDSDLDAIPNACDTTPLNVGDHDQDDEGWSNALDNCPRTANPTQSESESTAVYSTVAKRGGPRADGIGDACDNNNASVLPSTFQTTLTVTAQCIDSGPQVDNDTDGWCTVASPTSLNDPDDGNAIRTPEDYDLVFPMAIAHSGSGANPPMGGPSGAGIQSRQPAQVCSDGIDNDGDTLVDLLDSGPAPGNCRPKDVATTDTDGDGYSDEAEIPIGTDALGRCGGGNEGTGIPSRDWPSDLYSGGLPVSTDKANVLDLTSFIAPPSSRRLNTNPGEPAFDARWDIDPGYGPFNKMINVTDLTALIAGTSGFPPMFGGTTRAFNGPACTAHPTYGD